MANSSDWIYPTAQELANKTIRIENTDLEPVYMTMPTLNGKGIGNIKRIQIDMNVDTNCTKHITAKVTLYDQVKSKLARQVITEEVTLDNPELLLDAEVTEIEMRWKA